MEERKDSAESLEGKAPAAGADGVVDATNSDGKSSGGAVSNAPASGAKKSNFFKRLLGRLNIYVLIFLLLAVIGGGTVLVAYQLNKKQANTSSTTKLSADELSKLNNSDTTVGDAKQTLTVESNAVFTGKVLVRDGLDVAGALKVGGSLSLSGLNVSGTSTLDQVLLNKLSASGDVAIQGQLTVQKNLTVTGSATFAGPISAPRVTVDTLQLNKDLQLNKHVEAGGLTPKVSSGTGVGGGGTVSISGSDTAGTVTINIGGSPGAGSLAVITFNQAFNGTPHVVITPVGSGAGVLNYYITRSATGFTIFTANVPGGGSFSFDYIVID
jgi:cytoskeletal protein CcmA (bactofilin family)